MPNNLSKINWAKKGEEFEVVLDKMDKSMLPGIKDNVTNEHLNMIIFKMVATLRFWIFNTTKIFTISYFRFHNQSEIFKNLYFVGAKLILVLAYLDYYPLRKFGQFIIMNGTKNMQNLFIGQFFFIERYC